MFFGRLSCKEQLRSSKFEDRRTALFVQGFRSDRKLMRYTIDMRRSQCGIGAGDVGSENGMNHSLGETLSSISEENGDHDLNSGDHAGLRFDEYRFVSQTGVGETDFHLKHNSPVSVDTDCDGATTDVCSDDSFHENEALVVRNGEVCVPDWDGNSSQLLHFFASVCALEPHIEDCRRNVKDDIVVLEKTTRDSECDKTDANGNGDGKATDDTPSSDSGDTSYDTADDMTDDSASDKEEDVSGVSDSDGLSGDMSEGVSSGESCDIEGDLADTSARDVSPSYGDKEKLDTPNIGRNQDNCHDSPSSIGMDADSHDETRNCCVDCEVNDSAIESEERHHARESLNVDEEITFRSFRRDVDVETGRTCEASDVATIECEISRLELIADGNVSVKSTRETVTDACPDCHGDGVPVATRDGDVDVTRVIKSEQSVDGVSESCEGLGVVPGFDGHSINMSTPGVALQRIHDAGCSAFQVYRSGGVAKREPEWCQESIRKCINEEVSVKLDFDGVTVKTENVEASDVSMAIADPAMSFVCDTPDFSNTFSHESDIDKSTPTFIPPTPHINMPLNHPPVHGCHGDSTVSDRYIAEPIDARSASDQTVSACSRRLNHSIPCYPPMDQSVVQDRKVSHTNLCTPGNNFRQHLSGRTFTPTVLQESPMTVAKATPAGSRNRVASPGVVFTEHHFSPTVSLRHFREETPISRSVCPGMTVCDDDEGDDVVPPTPSVSQQLSHLSVVFTETYYSPTCVGDANDLTPRSCDAADDSSTSQRIIFTEKNFSPVVITNEFPLSRVASCRKTSGSSTCDRGATLLAGDAGLSPCVNHKGRSQQRVNK